MVSLKFTWVGGDCVAVESATGAMQHAYLARPGKTRCVDEESAVALEPIATNVPHKFPAWLNAIGKDYRSERLLLPPSSWRR
jgi:hypothetical protein